MKIYTGFGDSGRTQLFGGQVVDKDDLRVEAYGAADELNSHLGLIISHLEKDEWVNLLQDIQDDIFRISTELATPREKEKKIKGILITGDNIKKIENNIDDLESNLAPLKNFILPGGSEASAVVHIARTVCRRLERRLVGFAKLEEIDQNILVYINRLSDFLFVFARYLNKESGCDDILWTNRSSEEQALE